MDETTRRLTWENVVDSLAEARDVRFEREWFYVAAAVLGWVAFWDMADRHQGNFRAHALAWLAIGIAVMTAWYL